ncbi:MAG TPA: hypothetical protein VM942_10755 [Acidimicrobiales bacterium]|nr:hypothetical protein [Acidimicrobiales bacterium]
MASEGIRVVRDLRRARRRHAYREIDWTDALYRVYLTAFLSVGAVSVLSGWVGGRFVTPEELDSVIDRGPAVVGLAVALALAVGLRSGGRGGPLVLQPADVAHLLMAPVPRGAVLRGPAARQLRFRCFVGAVAGMVIGNLAARRLPGGYAEWVAWGGAAGAIAGLAFTASALVASGLRAGRRVAALLALLTVGWSVADLILGLATSPATYLGRLANSPLDRLGAPGVGLVLLLLPAVGLAAVGGTSLEAARRQAGLLAQLRFALTLQDVRTVILLRRQLAAEGPRRRPWFRLPPGSRRPVWRRDWQGVLRWPAVRLARLVALGVVAGLAASGAWRGTPALVVVAAAALLVAALEAVEGLAQEADHPVRLDTLPVRSGRLVVRHLAVPFVVTLVVVTVAVGAALVSDGSRTVLTVGAVMVVPASLAAVAGAALSVQTDPVDPLLVLEPLGATRLLVRAAAPTVLAVAAVLPVLSGRAALDAGLAPEAGAGIAAAAVLLAATAAVAWLRRAGTA